MLCLDSPQYVLLGVRTKTANKAGNSFFVQAQTFSRHFQFAELVEKLKSRHPPAARPSPLPIDQAGRRLRAQPKTLIGEGIHPIGLTELDFFHTLLNSLG